MGLAFDLSFKVLAPALVGAIGVKVVELGLLVFVVVILLPIWAGWSAWNMGRD